jgi:hypothetical protein
MSPLAHSHALAPLALNLGFAHQDCGTSSVVLKNTRTAVQSHAWTAVQYAPWIASPPSLMDSGLDGLSYRRLRWPSSAARADGHNRVMGGGGDGLAPEPGRSTTTITSLSVHELPSTQSILGDRTAC